MVLISNNIRKKLKNITGKEWVTLISLAAGHIVTPLLFGALPVVPISSNFEVNKKINVMGVVSHTLQTGIAMVLFHKLASAMSTDSTEDEENEA